MAKTIIRRAPPEAEKYYVSFYYADEASKKPGELRCAVTFKASDGYPAHEDFPVSDVHAGRDDHTDFIGRLLPFITLAKSNSGL